MDRFVLHTKGDLKKKMDMLTKGFRNYLWISDTGQWLQTESKQISQSLYDNIESGWII